jgi:hypothetical protein
LRTSFLPIAITLLIAGCAITRVDPPPPVTPPASYKEAGLWQHASTTNVPPVPDEWWAMFGDPVLDDLERRLVIGNENLKVAAAQVASARATYVASRAALWPTLSTAVIVTRSGSSQSTPAGAQNTQNPVNSMSAGAIASWEVDRGSKLSQAESEAQASYQASADDLAAARLSTRATLAQTYFLMRTAEIQQALLERTAAGYQRSYDLAQVRYEGGVAARTDVLLAKTQLTGAQAQAIESATQRAQLEHAIAVLLGTPPSSFSIARSGKLPPVPVVPEMLPATLLERRPTSPPPARRRRLPADRCRRRCILSVADAVGLRHLPQFRHRQPVQRAESLLVARAFAGARDPRRRPAPAREFASPRLRRPSDGDLPAIGADGTAGRRRQPGGRRPAAAADAAADGSAGSGATQPRDHARTIPGRNGELYQRRRRSGIGAQQRKQPDRPAEPSARGGEPTAEEHRRTLGNRFKMSGPRTAHRRY